MKTYAHTFFIQVVYHIESVYQTFFNNVLYFVISNNFLIDNR